jgi:hypothetical protein
MWIVDPVMDMGQYHCRLTFYTLANAFITLLYLANATPPLVLEDLLSLHPIVDTITYPTMFYKNFMCIAFLVISHGLYVTMPL